MSPPATSPPAMSQRGYLASPCLSTPEFCYRASQDGGETLHAEGLCLRALADLVHTPCYLYSAAVLRRNFLAYTNSLEPQSHLIAYSVKANGNLALLSILAGLGAGADVVSLGELERARTAGIPAARCVFSGVGKTEAELAAALELGIYQINVESAHELEQLAKIAEHKGRKAPVALRINPNIAAGGHSKISTGRSGDKFGLSVEHAGQLFAIYAHHPHIDLLGLAAHIGSQILDLAPLRRLVRQLLQLRRTWSSPACQLKRIDIGGGLGIAYQDETAPSIQDYTALVQEEFKGQDLHLIIEPGRSIVGNAGVMLSRVIRCKPGNSHPIIILDAGMNDLLRPALYGTSHRLLSVVKPQTEKCTPCDLVGPICESSDRFAQNVLLPPLETNDLVALTHCGAYGATMASQYNARPLVAEALVDGYRWALVRARPPLEALWELEEIPPWLSDSAQQQLPLSRA